MSRPRKPTATTPKKAREAAAATKAREAAAARDKVARGHSSKAKEMKRRAQPSDDDDDDDDDRGKQTGREEEEVEDDSESDPILPQTSKAAITSTPMDLTFPPNLPGSVLMLDTMSIVRFMRGNSCTNMPSHDNPDRGVPPKFYAASAGTLCVVYKDVNDDDLQHQIKAMLQHVIPNKRLHNELMRLARMNGNATVGLQSVLFNTQLGRFGRNYVKLMCTQLSHKNKVRLLPPNLTNSEVTIWTLAESPVHFERKLNLANDAEDHQHLHFQRKGWFKVHLDCIGKYIHCRFCFHCRCFSHLCCGRRHMSTVKLSKPQISTTASRPSSSLLWR